MRRELNSLYHNSAERVRNSPRIQGVIAASIFFLGGIAIYIPDHNLMGLSFPHQISGEVFDMFGGAWSASMARIFRRDDIVASVFVGWTAPAVIEKLQELHMIPGVYNSLDYAAPLFGIAVYLATYYGIKLKHRAQQTKGDFLLGEDFPFKDIRKIKLIDNKFPLLRKTIGLK